MPFEQQLRVPGPTPLPERVVRAASRPMINHRGPEFAELLSAITTDLQWAMQTRNDVLLFPASGTGGLEAAAVNLLSPGERVLVCTVGSFGDRWADIAAGFGADVVRLAMPWGEAVDAGDVARLLDENAGIEKVFVTHNETSTGVTNDIPAIASVARERGKLMVVDSVSGAGCLPLATDDLGLDVVVTGSQKGWMAPPGLTMVAVSEAALEASARATCPRWYFDFAREKKFQDRRQTYTTPPVGVMFALREGLAMMREEGLENVFARHSRVAGMVRAGVAALGLEFLAPEGSRSDTVTAVHSPASSPDDLKALLGWLRTERGLVLAGGQGKLSGQIFRIGHLGWVNDADAYSILATLEDGLVAAGIRSGTGAAVPAAQGAALAPSAAAANGAHR